MSAAFSVRTAPDHAGPGALVIKLLLTAPHAWTATDLVAARNFVAIMLAVFAALAIGEWIFARRVRMEEERAHSEARLRYARHSLRVR